VERNGNGPWQRKFPSLDISPFIINSSLHYAPLIPFVARLHLHHTCSCGSLHNQWMLASRCRSPDRHELFPCTVQCSCRDGHKKTWYDTCWSVRVLLKMRLVSGEKVWFYFSMSAHIWTWYVLDKCWCYCCVGLTTWDYVYVLCKNNVSDPGLKSGTRQKRILLSNLSDSHMSARAVGGWVLKGTLI